MAANLPNLSQSAAVELLRVYEATRVAPPTLPMHQVAFCALTHAQPGAERAGVLTEVLKAMAALPDHVDPSLMSQQAVASLVNGCIKDMRAPGLLAVLHACSEVYHMHPQHVGVDFDQWSACFAALLPDMDAAMLIHMVDALGQLYAGSEDGPPYVERKPLSAALARCTEVKHGGVLAMLLYNMARWPLLPKLVSVNDVVRQLTGKRAVFRSCAPSLVPRMFDSLTMLGGAPRSFDWDGVCERLLQWLNMDRIPVHGLCRVVQSLGDLSRVHRQGGSCMPPKFFNHVVTAYVVEQLLSSTHY